MSKHILCSSKRLLAAHPMNPNGLTEQNLGKIMNLLAKLDLPMHEFPMMVNIIIYGNGGGGESKL